MENGLHAVDEGGRSGMLVDLRLFLGGRYSQ